MKQRKLVLSDAAVYDILEQASLYQENAGTTRARKWEQAVTSTLLKIADNALTGSPCKFEAAALKDVRRSAIPGFPKHLAFYRVFARELLVLRIVHGARDLESLF